MFFRRFQYIFRTLFSLGVSVCTHTRQVEHQRCIRTGRVQKKYKILRKNTIINEHPVAAVFHNILQGQLTVHCTPFHKASTFAVLYTSRLTTTSRNPSSSKSPFKLTTFRSQSFQGYNYLELDIFQVNGDRVGRQVSLDVSSHTPIHDRHA